MHGHPQLTLHPALHSTPELGHAMTMREPVLAPRSCAQDDFLVPTKTAVVNMGG